MKESVAKVKVIQPPPPEEPVTAELLAQSIRRIGDAADAFGRAGLTQRAVEVLLRDSSGVGLSEIRSVLGAMKSLRRMYLAPPPAK